MYIGHLMRGDRYANTSIDDRGKDSGGEVTREKTEFMAQGPMMMAR